MAYRDEKGIIRCDFWECESIMNGETTPADCLNAENKTQAESKDSVD